MDDPLKDMTLKTAPSPEYAYVALIMKLRPILNEGIFDTGLVNLSKLEDNYDAFIKTIDSDYEKICYYLAMLEIMFNFEEENSSNRAVFLMDRFDERKIKLDETQYYFYLKNRIRYADYKKDEELIRKYNSELTEKYPPDTGYMDLDTGKLIKDKKEIEKIKKDFERSRGVLENEEH